MRFLPSFHLGIPTNHAEETVRFYRALGFTEVTKEPHAAIPVYFLRNGDLMIEVYELREELPHCTGAIDHLCVDVDDLDAARALVEQCGFPYAQETEEFLPYWEHGIRFFKVFGPNGETVEICQKLTQ